MNTSTTYDVFKGIMKKSIQNSKRRTNYPNSVDGDYDISKKRTNDDVYFITPGRSKGNKKNDSGDESSYEESSAGGDSDSCEDNRKKKKTGELLKLFSDKVLDKEEKRKIDKSFQEYQRVLSEIKKDPMVKLFILVHDGINSPLKLFNKIKHSHDEEKSTLDEKTILLQHLYSKIKGKRPVVVEDYFEFLGSPVFSGQLTLNPDVTIAFNTMLIYLTECVNSGENKNTSYTRGDVIRIVLEETSLRVLFSKVIIDEVVYQRKIRNAYQTKTSTQFMVAKKESINSFVRSFKEIVQK